MQVQVRWLQAVVTKYLNYSPVIPFNLLRWNLSSFGPIEPVGFFTSGTCPLAHVYLGTTSSISNEETLHSVSDGIFLILRSDAK